MYLKKQLFLIFILCAIQFPYLKPADLDQFDHIKGCVFGGLIGDCLGKPTEFINSLEKIFKIYPKGIKNFQDLKDNGLFWTNELTGQIYAPYTDDTAMALVTLKVLLEAREKNLDLDNTMIKLAKAYILDMSNPNGWAMGSWIMKGRPFGWGCWKNLSILRCKLFIQKICPCKIKVNWQGGGQNDMGCGSVMRAYPFGLVFADQPEQAAEWAAQHSKITHGHPSAQAACAVMAIAVAYAIQGKDYDYIIEQMINTAKKYDPTETHFNPYTKQQEKSTWGKIQDALKAGSNFNKNLNGDRSLDYKIEKSQGVFKKYLGWAADDAIAATAYIFAISCNNVNDAICLGVHTPGDSDSIASMAGALVGAYVGAEKLDHNVNDFEGSKILEEYANQVVQLCEQN